MPRTSLRLLTVVSAVLGLLVVTGASPARAAGGYDDPNCVPSAAHPNPVVLLHGLGAPPGGNYRFLGPELAAAGYCTFPLDYGATAPFNYPGGFAPIEESAADIRDFVLEVQARTGAASVDIVGHSEGGFLSLYVPKRHDLGAVVGRVVALAPPTHGTDASGLFTLFRATNTMRYGSTFTGWFGCHACDDLAISEDAISALEDGPIAQPGIDYTVIASRYDVVVTPTETSFVDEPGVTNTVVQDVCPFDPVGHIGLAFDATVVDMITNALDPSTAAPVACSFGPPF